MFLYLHGFNGSPASVKAHQLRERLRRLGQEASFECPPLSTWPDEAIATADALVARAGADRTVLVGSSLGGFYATWLAERHGCAAVLLNPALEPHTGLEAYLGPQRNLYTHEPWELTRAHLAQMAGLAVAAPTHPERYLLMVTTGDELLDWRAAAARFQGARQVVVQGSDHGFADFHEHLDTVMDFADAWLAGARETTAPAGRGPL